MTGVMSKLCCLRNKFCVGQSRQLWIEVIRSKSRFAAAFTLRTLAQRKTVLVIYPSNAHVRPFPVNPTSQLQLKDPGVLLQEACWPQPASAGFRHSSMSSHCAKPSPLYPTRQTHWKLPGRLVQAAAWWQRPRAHSSMSAHVFPSPWYPGEQLQLYEPGQDQSTYDIAYSNPTWFAGKTKRTCSGQLDRNASSAE